MKYIDRTGNKREETSGQDKLLAWIYGHAFTRLLMKPLVSPALSKLGGRLLDSRLSALAVPRFVRKNQIDLDEYEEQKFRSYNAFFTRRIRAGLRPIDSDEEVFISPCDGKASVYPIDALCRFVIKHTPYTVEQLVRNKRLAAYYEGGYAIVLRLTVDDYHRYCYVDNGEKSGQIHIPGVLHTVNPAANDVLPIYKMNAREYCLLRTEHFGTVLMMEVGALMVGRINNYHQRCQVKKGQEKGRFEFGGSTIVLLTQKGKVKVDEDILRNTEEGYETIVKMGEKIGKK